MNLTLCALENTVIVHTEEQGKGGDREQAEIQQAPAAAAHRSETLRPFV